MRHVRMLGLCLVALLVMSAAAAGQALAGEYTGEWAVFNDCPINNPEIKQALQEESEGAEVGVVCFSGRTAGGKHGGHFTVGKVTTPLNLPITLQGGSIYHYPEEQRWEK